MRRRDPWRRGPDIPRAVVNRRAHHARARHLAAAICTDPRAYWRFGQRARFEMRFYERRAISHGVNYRPRVLLLGRGI